jgi:hypothetical protein
MHANPQHTGHLSWVDRLPFNLLIASVTTLLMTVVTPPHAAAENAKVEAFSHAPYAEKINLNLLDLENQVRHGATSLTRAATRMAMNTAGEGIRVDIVMNRVDEDVLDDLRDLGLFIQHVSDTHRRISAVVDVIAVL